MALSSGVYSLIGVAVGSLGTGGFQWWLAKRAEHRDARVARRQIASELRRLQLTLERVVKSPETLSFAAPRLAQRDMWTEHSNRLAAALSSDQAWDEVQEAYNSLASYCNLVSQSGEVSTDITEHVKAQVDRALLRVRP